MEAAATCRRVGMLARLNGDLQENYGPRCPRPPTHRVLMRQDPVSGLRVEVQAELCTEDFLLAQLSPALVRFWPIRDRSRPDTAATSPAAES